MVGAHRFLCCDAHLVDSVGLRPDYVRKLSKRHGLPEQISVCYEDVFLSLDVKTDDFIEDLEGSKLKRRNPASANTSKIIKTIIQWDSENYTRDVSQCLRQSIINQNICFNPEGRALYM